MGRENDVMLEYLDDNERFADLFNGDLFHGEQVILAEDLTEGSEIYVEEYQDDWNQSALPVKTGRQRLAKTTSRMRDIKKRLRSGSVLRVLAIENQNLVNYAMPWRHMNYDCLEYGKQIRNRRKENKRNKALKTSAERMCGLQKEDRLVPTYTVCVYHGTEKWDGPRSLKDMMDFGEDGERWADLFTNYQMHLICINEITDFDRFHSPLKEFLQLLSCREDKDALQRLLLENPAFERIDEETAKAANVLMGENRLMGKKNEEEETYNMCGALLAIKEDFMREGRLEGKTEAFAALSNLFNRLKQDGRLEEWFRVMEDGTYRDKLLQEYELSDGINE